jgi:hypothetical protein
MAVAYGCGGAGKLKELGPADMKDDAPALLVLTGLETCTVFNGLGTTLRRKVATSGEGVCD